MGSRIDAPFLYVPWRSLIACPSPATAPCSQRGATTQGRSAARPLAFPTFPVSPTSAAAIMATLRTLSNMNKTDLVEIADILEIPMPRMGTKDVVVDAIRTYLVNLKKSKPVPVFTASPSAPSSLLHQRRTVRRGGRSAVVL